MSKYTEYELQFLKDNYPTRGRKFCAESLGRTVDGIKDKVKNMMLVSDDKYTRDELEFINENYEKWGGAYCAKVLGRSHDSLGNKARSMGLTADTAIKHPDMCPNFDSCVIESPTKEFAYGLGFIWADGYITNYTTDGVEHHRIEWEVIKTDADVILPIFETFSTWSRYFRKRRGTWKETSTQTINNRWCYKLLNELGFSPKDKNDGFGKCLEYLPKELHKFFILGFFDGDGYMGYTDKVKQVSFTSCIDYDWNTLGGVLTELGIEYRINKYTHPTKGHKSSKLFISKRVEVDKFYKEFINPNLDFGLLRKRPIIQHH
jgi:hypothetical protein